jgi:TfoX/Sxy family transcriptional regulator of competence genes
MAYDTQLADEIRTAIGAHPGLSEREMFGGISFMINGNMAVGVIGDELMVRVGKDAHAEVVEQPGARPLEMGSRSMKGWVAVSQEVFPDEDAFETWVARGVAYAESLPAK